MSNMIHDEDGRPTMAALPFPERQPQWAVEELLKHYYAGDILSFLYGEFTEFFNSHVFDARCSMAMHIHGVEAEVARYRKIGTETELALLKKRANNG